MYSIQFIFTIFMGRWKQGKNVISFGVDNSSSVHIDGGNKNILVLGEWPTQGLDNATVTAVLGEWPPQGLDQFFIC